jgi:hypothetical protein
MPRKKVLSVRNLNGLFEPNEIITGDSSGATANVNTIVEHLSHQNEEIQALQTNNQLLDESTTLVEWDPNNPLA